MTAPMPKEKLPHNDVFLISREINVTTVSPVSQK